MTDRVRYVVLTGGRNGFPRAARTYATEPRVSRHTLSDGRPHIASGWPGGTGFGEPVRGVLADFDAWGGAGRCMAREIDEASAAVIAGIDAEIDAAKATLARLHSERVEACEAAAARGRKVRVPT